MLDVVLSHLPNLITVFLGIFLEAGPFLLFGVLVSGALEVGVSTERLAGRFSGNGVLGLAKPAPHPRICKAAAAAPLGPNVRCTWVVITCPAGSIMVP